jgi:hypothetical protein
VDDDDWVLQPELVDDGLDLAKLVPGGRTVRGGLVGGAPAQEVEGHDPAGRDEMGDHPIVQVQVVGKPMHQQDRVPLTRIVADIDPVTASPNRRLLKRLAPSSGRRQLETPPCHAQFPGLASPLSDRYSVCMRFLT